VHALQGGPDEYFFGRFSDAQSSLKSGERILRRSEPNLGGALRELIAHPPTEWHGVWKMIQITTLLRRPPSSKQ